MENGHELDQQPWEFFFHQSPKPMVNDKLSTKVLSEYLSLAELNTKYLDKNVIRLKSNFFNEKKILVTGGSGFQDHI